MSNKLQLNQDKIEDFLKANFNQDSKIVKEFTQNEVSKAFLFTASGKEYVIRVDSTLSNFKRDKYAYEHFSTSKIIIPETIQLGEMKNLSFYSITSKLDGVIMDDLDQESFGNSLLDFALVVKEIHGIDLDSTIGFGDWNPEDGNGNHKMWKDFLLSLEDDNYFDWDKLFKKGIFEEEHYHKIFNKMRDLSVNLSEDRKLIHGDLGYNNILIKDGKVSGVLDWGISKYGDFIYDFAWLDFWTNITNYSEILKPNYKKEALFNFDERILCYKLHVALTTMGFFAVRENREGYRDASSRALRLL